MDASALRWVLAIIGIVLLVGIYLYGLHQNRLRKRAAVETFTREEIDSAFIEDEQLREELDNLNQIMEQGDLNENFDKIKINRFLISRNFYVKHHQFINLFLIKYLNGINWITNIFRVWEIINKLVRFSYVC